MTDFEYIVYLCAFSMMKDDNVFVKSSHLCGKAKKEFSPT